jgi:hypothetical protein
MIFYEISVSIVKKYFECMVELKNINYSRKTKRNQ